MMRFLLAPTRTCRYFLLTMRARLNSRIFDLVINSGGHSTRTTHLSRFARMAFSTNPIKPWESNVVESKGDYRKEMFLEKHIGGQLYENQDNLPRLPIPSIADTIKRFVPTALPLAKTDEERESFKSACRNFPEEAAELQERLIARRDGEMKNSSWLQEWWNQGGYLQVRDPVVVYVSYFFGFVDDPTVDSRGAGSPNVQRGATLLFAAAQFRKQVVSGDLPYERIGRKQIPLDATAYKYMFNACRIPRRDHDTYRIYDPSRYTHAVVARRGHFFSIELVNPETGNPLPVTDLEAQLRECLILADAIPSSRPKLGLMTSNNRDEWAAAREKLLEVGGVSMEEAMERVESGAVVLNLDDESPVSRQECASIYWTGDLKSGNNRWFDKSIQLIVTNNGKAGLCAEHSMMDGMPVINFSDFVTKMTYAEALQQSKSLESSPHGVMDIFGRTLETMPVAPVEELESEAWTAFHELITDHSLHVQSFQGYGSNFIKSCKFGPDAFVQVAMQLATYRLFGEQAGTYEATQVRSFLHGRTEVTRAVSTDSEAFIKCMGLRPKQDEHDPVSKGEKLALLQKAIDTHSSYTGIAAKAQGVDRHLFGLSMMVQEGEDAPALYSDPLFGRSKRWRVSTSQLTHPRFNIWGYGEVVPDGVGLSYAILPNSCVFNITALTSTGWTDKLAELLEEALLEIKRVAEDDKMPKSKL